MTCLRRIRRIPSVIAEQKAAEEKKTREKGDYEKKLADGQKKVDDFVKRFGPWYYVTPGDSFRSINLDRACPGRAQKAAGCGGRRSRGRWFSGGAAQGISRVAAGAMRFVLAELATEFRVESGFAKRLATTESGWCRSARRR